MDKLNNSKSCLLNFKNRKIFKLFYLLLRIQKQMKIDKIRFLRMILKNSQQIKIKKLIKAEINKIIGQKKLICRFNRVIAYKHIFFEFFFFV